MVFTSLENEKIKNLIKLQRKKYRDLTGTYIVEGMHLVEEAYKKNHVLEVFIVEGENCPFNIQYSIVSAEVMKKISTMDTPSTIIALCEKNKDDKIVGKKILLLDEIQDPGNLGTIIRSSVAFNIDTIVLSPNTVDLYNPKVLRSTQGMYNHVTIITMDLVKAIAYLKDNNYTVFGTNVYDGVDVREISSLEKEKYCLVVGNEGNGVSKEIQDLCDKNLYISMNNEVESLNVGVACSILLYELGR